MVCAGCTQIVIRAGVLKLRTTCRLTRTSFYVQLYSHCILRAGLLKLRSMYPDSALRADLLKQHTTCRLYPDCASGAGLLKLRTMRRLYSDSVLRADLFRLRTGYRLTRIVYYVHAYSEIVNVQAYSDCVLCTGLFRLLTTCRMYSECVQRTCCAETAYYVHALLRPRITCRLSLTAYYEQTLLRQRTTYRLYSDYVLSTCCIHTTYHAQAIR